MTTGDLREATTAKLADTWGSITSVCRALDEAAWALPTACPGWSVQDNLSHLVGTERGLAGDPPIGHRAASLEHVRNPIGEANEHEVDSRRHLPGAAVLAEWEEVVARRLQQLREATDEDLAAPSWTPVGPGSLLDFLQIRVLDAWVHEQDIRRAVGRPGGDAGPAAAHTVDRLLLGLPMVVGKRAGAPEGAVVALRLVGAVARHVAVGVEGGRARTLEVVPAAATTTLEAATLDWVALATGRVGAGDVAVRVEGDQALAQAVLAGANTMI